MFRPISRMQAGPHPAQAVFGVSPPRYRAAPGGGNRRDDEERQKANDELEKMREQRRRATETEISEIKASLNELKKNLKEHAAADKADVILNELKNISGEQTSQSAMITNISGEVKQLLVADGVRKEKIDSLERYIKGVDTSLREHKRNHPGGK